MCQKVSYFDYDLHGDAQERKIQANFTKKPWFLKDPISCFYRFNNIIGKIAKFVENKKEERKKK